MGLDIGKIRKQRAKQTTARQQAQPWLAVFVVAVVGLGLFIAITEKPAPPPPVTIKKTTTPAAAKNCYTKSGYIYGINQEYFNRGLNMLIDKDSVALAKLQQAGVVGFLKPGVKVFREDVSLLSGVVQIRPEGQTVTVWTNIEAVDCR